jgi:class I fructose-bisphosphate aldolase
MNTGKLTRMNRLFSDPSGCLCSVAVDHFIGYGAGMPDGFRHIQTTLAAIVAGRPDAITMHKGMAASAWTAYAGRLPLIMQSTIARPDDTACEQIANPEDAIRLGADGFAVAAFIRGDTEAAHLRTVAACVHEAARYELPVVCHIYPRHLPGPGTISTLPEDIAWAVRCAVEVGADVIKTPYCGDSQAFAQIASDCPVPLVAAGGPQAETLESALAVVAEAVRSGARGATIGRNIWGATEITAAVLAFKGVVHQGLHPRDALRATSPVGAQ